MSGTPSLELAGMLHESLLQLGVLSVSFILPHLALGMAWEVVLPDPRIIFVPPTRASSPPPAKK